MRVPSMLLRQLYTSGSLENVPDGVRFSLKNRLSDAVLVGLERLAIDGRDVPRDAIRLHLGGGVELSADQLSPTSPVAFPFRASVDVLTRIPHLMDGTHQLDLGFDVKPFGRLRLRIECGIRAEPEPPDTRIPRDHEDDYAAGPVAARQEFVERMTSSRLDHVTRFSFDPHAASGNCEHFVGVAQVPLGLAGPLRVRGEHAVGEFFVPLATTEGTLVASYNRGMKILNLCGGVTTTVVADAMQRAPVFIFANARD